MKYNLGYLFDLLVVITNKDLKVRYKSSVFGYLWSIANPLLFAMIYYFIFKLIMRVQIPLYPFSNNGAVSLAVVCKLSNKFTFFIYC